MSYVMSVCLWVYEFSKPLLFTNTIFVDNRYIVSYVIEFQHSTESSYELRPTSTMIWAPLKGRGYSDKNVFTPPQGQLKDGIPEGRGVIKWLDGSWYRGEFLKGLRHGRGLHVSCEKGRRWYSGEWTNGKRNGRGETACCVGQPDGALNYSGDWVDGRPHGSGTASWPDETRYTGGWARGRQHGRGKAVWPNDHVSFVSIGINVTIPISRSSEYVYVKYPRRIRFHAEILYNNDQWHAREGRRLGIVSTPLSDKSTYLCLWY